MERTLIRLADNRELKIFMDPVRQSVLRAMALLGAPVTAKRLADELGIQPASAKYHLGRLQSIGLVAPDHTEQIHGITAKYYRLVPADVSLGLDEPSRREERAAVAGRLLSSVVQSCLNAISAPSAAPDAGDVYTGVVHLTKQQLDEFLASAARFTRENEAARPGAAPYEFALAYYSAGARK